MEEVIDKAEKKEKFFKELKEEMIDLKQKATSMIPDLETTYKSEIKDILN